MCTQQAVITPSFCRKRWGRKVRAGAEYRAWLRFKEDRQEITQGEALNSKIRGGNLTNVRQLIGNVTTLDLSKAHLTRLC